MLGYDT